MLTSFHLLLKRTEVCIKTTSTSASLPLKGQVTKYITVKWAIESLLFLQFSFEIKTELSYKFVCTLFPAARIEYENFYMTQSSQKLLSPSSGVNISVPVPGSFQHSKDTSMAQPAGTPKTGRNRPQIPIPDIPAQGETI